MSESRFNLYQRKMLKIKNYMENERSWKSVPFPVLILLVSFLSFQIIYSGFHGYNPARARSLPWAPVPEEMHLVSLGDEIAMARITMLWLQAFDNQPGISIPFLQLDYDHLISWLEVILKLDGNSQYPLLAASRIYTQVPDELKQRKMLDFVYHQFLSDPDNRWPSMAHAVYVAKHKLNDFELALKYADALTQYVSKDGVPYWVRQMKIYVLEDMGEIESAKILIGGLIDSGTIKDPHELEFLKNRLKLLEQGG